MALGDSAGLLFRIKADGSQAESELRKITGTVSGLGGGFASAAGPIALVSAGIIAVGAAAATAAVALFKLTEAAAEYGSKIFDASQKTGLGAETMSALKFAADQSGSSLEAITNSVSKFSVLLGQAAAGNEKAQKTLALYGVTAKDTDTALTQAISTIAQMTDTTQQSAAAAALFKDRTAEILPVIKSFDGDLPALMDKLRDLGLLMSKEDAEAADKFGDTLDTLNAQAAALGRQFATELMPAMTDAMNAISRAMAENKDVAAEWGKFVIDTARGVEFVMVSAGNSINDVLAAISLGLINQQSAWAAWAVAARIAIAIVTGGLSEVLWALSKIGAWLNQKSLGIADIRMADDTNTKPGFAIPSLRGGGGGGRGRGGGGGGGGQNTALQEAEAEMRQRMALLKAENAEVLAQLDQRLKGKRIREQDYIVAVRDLKQQEIQAEIDGYQKILDTQKLKAKERVEIENKIKVLQIEQVTEATKSETKLAELKAKNADEELKLGEKIDEAEKKRLQKISDLKQQEFLKEQYRRKREQEDATRREMEGRIGILGASPIVQLDEFGRFEEHLSAIPVLAGMAGQAIQQLAAGVGNLVQQWVLYGTAGPNALKKMVASVLAGVAAQAAVLAIMELAYGIAALTPWGAAIYGPAPPHFKAAALFGIVAAGAALAGRAVAGDSFNQASGQATGQGGGQAAQQNNFTTQFQGFGQQQTRANERMIEVLGAVEEATHQLHNKLMRTTPGELVALGAGDASREIREAYHSELAGDVRTTDGMMRNSGQVR